MTARSRVLCLAGLLAIAFVATRAADWHKKALVVEVAYKVPPPLPWTSCEQRLVYLRVLRGGNVRILMSMEFLSTTDLDRRLRQLFATRVERILFIDAEPEASFREFLEVVSVAKKSVDHVAVVTPAMARATGCLTFGQWEKGQVFYRH